jgi:hypothetical protein
MPHMHQNQLIQEVLENAFPEQELSNSFQLYHNYPNPFNSTTTISYDLLKNAGVIIKAYNLLGHEVKTLVNENQVAGYHSVTWNGTDYLGNIVSSGAYIYRLRVDDKIKTKKMLYIK